MAKFIIENQLDNIEDLKNFNEMNYKFSNDMSNQTNFVFIKNNQCFKFAKSLAKYVKIISAPALFILVSTSINV